MIIKIFSVYDHKVEAFLQPFFSPTVPSALRSLTEVVNDVNHTFHKHSNDYSVFDLGDFNDGTGEITAITPNRICGLFDLAIKTV